MTGLEKITSRILADANAQAQAILDEAAEKSRVMRAQNLADAQVAQDRLIADAEREGEALVVRAKSSAAMTRRNVELSAKSEMIDRAFARAMQEIYEMDRTEYAALLVSLLCKTLNAQRESERESLRLYGEDIAPAYYELMLNARDGGDVAGLIMDGVRDAAVSGKIPADMLTKVQLCAVPVDIDGGLVLRCGDIETNCSFSMMLASLRPALEPRIQQILYKDHTKS
jgi:V/A-type H+-transporting ATPase subunit E